MTATWKTCWSATLGPTLASASRSAGSRPSARRPCTPAPGPSWSPYLPAFAAQSGTVRVAYSFGTPVIASDTGALGETIRQDGSGWLAKPGDARDLASRMLEVVDDSEGRHARAATAKRLGQERSAQKLAPIILQIYEELGLQT